MSPSVGLLWRRSLLGSLGFDPALALGHLLVHPFLGSPPEQAAPQEGDQQGYKKRTDDKPSDELAHTISSRSWIVKIFSQARMSMRRFRKPPDPGHGLGWTGTAPV